jgi:hypothetical protein
MMETKEIDLKVDLAVIKEEDIKHLLEPGEVNAILEWTVTDKDGHVTSRGEKKCDSFVRQFIELLWIQMYQIGDNTPYNITDTGAGAGVVRPISEGAYNFGSNANAGDITFGPVVGLDNTPATINDHRLGTIILHDAGPHGVNTLQYSAVTFGAPASDASVSQFTITRNFANATAWAITLQEIGLYVKGIKTGVAYYFMSIRDAVVILIPIGQTLTLNYRIQASI